MGLCCSSTRYEQTSHYFKGQIREFIESNQHRKLSSVIHQMRASQDISTSAWFSIDDPIAIFSNEKTKNLELNALGYAIWCGSKDCFKYLYEKHGASIQKMNTLFLKSGKTPLGLICERGYIDILMYFLPIYLRNQQNEEIEQSLCYTSNEELSIFNEKTRSTQSLEIETHMLFSYTPLQIAVEKEYLEVVKFIVDNFPKGSMLNEFDLNYKDEVNGENCALISVRTANLRMVQYLHQQTYADFFAVNKRNENSMQIASVWSKKKPNRDYLGIIKYLIEEVNIDISSIYEEILLVCEDKAIIRYLEQVLKSQSIDITKHDIESRNKIISSTRSKTEIDDCLDRLSGFADFDFVELYYEFNKKHEKTGSECGYSEVSSIPIITRNTTPMVSFMSNLETIDENKVYK